MEPAIVLVILLVFGIPLALGLWLIVRAVGAKRNIEALAHRIGTLESELHRLRQEREREPAKPAPPVPAPEAKPVVVALVTPVRTAAPQPPALPKTSPAPLPSAVPVVPAPPKFVPSPPVTALHPLSKATSKINWEQFMGVKGFAWIGGFALFLGVAFFVKYSFDNNLVPPELRVAIGFLAGLALLTGGVSLSRKNFAALSQTLCATGVVILYAVTFACRSIYHFEFFGPLPTFLLMALITTTAFLLAVRLDALVVAMLGMLGGFLTPILLSTGQDNPLGLFGYLAILDAGLIVVALNQRWHFLAVLAALGTAILEIGWAGKFFVSEKYFEGDKIFIALAVLLGFNLLWLAANGAAQRRKQSNWWFAGGNLGLVAVALAFTLYFFDFAPLVQRPVLLFSFVLLIDLVVTALALLDHGHFILQSFAGLAVFGLLAIWTTQHLTNELLNAGLAFYLVFAILHSALPAWLQRRRGKAPGAATPLNHIFPPLALLLVLVPIFRLPELSFLVWPFVLLVDLLAIALAVITATLLPVLAVLLLTLAATGMMIFKIPSDLTGLPTSFFLLAAFAVFFVTASTWLARRFKPDAIKSGLKLDLDVLAPESVAALLPASSAVLPFLLLIMASLRLPLANPSPVFSLALLLVVLLLGLTRIFSLEWMPLVGLVSTFAVECAWHFNRFDLANPNLIAPPMLLGWYLVFYVPFAIFPFVFLRKFGDKTFPWAASALAGPAQFLLIFRVVKIAWPNTVMGLLPAAFAIPALLSLAAIVKTIPAESKSRMTQLAWFGGVALFFITLIFPIQFDRQWITIGWALEGAALLWLFHRVPHPGVRLIGVALLVAAFVRLALNPAVLEYHARATTPIFNWYLYAYGIAAICLFAGVKLLAPPRNVVLKSNAQPILAALGAVLAFLLLNIEIADYFSTPGSTLTFQFRGNFARDMTYSIAWALFALVLLVYGIIKNTAATRYSAMGLLCVTLVKLFFHDLAQLGQLYRIGAFVGVAVVAMLASFAYQKFFAARGKEARIEK